MSFINFIMELKINYNFIIKINPFRKKNERSKF